MFLLLLGCMPESQWLADPGLIELTELQARPIYEPQAASFTRGGDPLDLSEISFSERQPVVEHDEEYARLAVDISGMVRLLIWFELAELRPGVWQPLDLELGSARIYARGGSHWVLGATESPLFYRDPLPFPREDRPLTVPLGEPLLTEPDGEPMFYPVRELVLGGGCVIGGPLVYSDVVSAAYVEGPIQGHIKVRVHDRFNEVYAEGWVAESKVGTASRPYPVLDEIAEEAFGTGVVHTGWFRFRMKQGGEILPKGELLYDEQRNQVGLVLRDSPVQLGPPDDEGWIPVKLGEVSRIPLYLPPE